MKMKQLLALTLASLALAATMAGCSNSGAGESSSASNPSSSAGQNRLEQIKQAGKIVFVTSPDYAPYEFIDLDKMGQGDDQYVGADIELAKYIAQELGVELEIHPMDFDSVLASVTENKCDMAISGIASKPERAEKMDFFTPYKNKQENSQGIMIRKEDSGIYTSVETVNKPEVKVGAQNGSIQMEGAQQMLPDSNIVPIAKLGDGILQLQSGKIDALVISTTTGQGYCDSYPELMMADIPWDLFSDGSAVAIPKGNPELLEEINRIIGDVKEQGLYEKWLEEAQVLAAQQKEE